MERYIFNTILVHVSRTWERIRVKQPHQEMPMDNIESVDAIVSITDRIFWDRVIQKFVNMSESERKATWDWDKETGKGCSDVYIEELASEIILQEYLDN